MARQADRGHDHRAAEELPGVAIAISLVPPLAVAGLTLESGAPGQCLGALLLFATNVAAILASGIVVVTLYRAGQVSGQPAAPAFGRPIAVVIIVLLLAAVLVPLWINSDRIDETTIRQADVQAVAEHWADDAGWPVVSVTATGDQVLVDATGPRPAPDLAVLRQDLDTAGLAGLDVGVSLVTVSYQPLPKQPSNVPWRHQRSIVAIARRVPGPGQHASKPVTAVLRAGRCHDPRNAASGQSRSAAHARHQTLAFRRCSAGRPPVRR